LCVELARSRSYAETTRDINKRPLEEEEEEEEEVEEKFGVGNGAKSLQMQYLIDKQHREHLPWATLRVASRCNFKSTCSVRRLRRLA
jgi:hypothetical protein